jgi:hypothetical protein
VAGNGRIALAFGLIGAMLVALIFLLVNNGDGEPEAGPTTQITVAPTTATTLATTTTVADTTTTSLDPDERVAEVERILEDLEIAWYDAVYRQDESGLGDIVATRRTYEDAVAAMETLAPDFVSAPSDETIDLEVFDVLLDREDCLVVHFNLNLSGVLGPGAAVFPGVQVLWPAEDGSYRLANLWTNPVDLWQDDCDLMDRTEIP